MHNDHADGLTKRVDDEIVPVFPNARFYLSAVERDEVRHPNARTSGTYLPDNWMEGYND